MQLSKASDDIQVSSKSIEAAFSKFLNDYAAVEDRIHHLWTDVIKEHQKLEVGLFFSSQWLTVNPRTRLSSREHTTPALPWSNTPTSSTYPHCQNCREPVKVRTFHYGTS
jgi:hypothetical protein